MEFNLLCLGFGKTSLCQTEGYNHSFVFKHLNLKCSKFNIKVVLWDCNVIKTRFFDEKATGYLFIYDGTLILIK